MPTTLARVTSAQILGKILTSQFMQEDLQYLIKYCWLERGPLLIKIHLSQVLLLLWISTGWSNNIGPVWPFCVQAMRLKRKKLQASATNKKQNENSPISRRKCGAEIIFSSDSSEDGRARLNTSILISQIVDKLWANEKRAVQLRQEGNKLFQVGGKVGEKQDRDNSGARGGR